MDLNHRHRAYETPALPLSYTARGRNCTRREPAESTGGILGDVFEPSEDKVARERCPVCQQQVPVGVLRPCMICRTLFCRRCAIEGYGREFCSPVCRDYFFHGDGDESDEDA